MRILPFAIKEDREEELDTSANAFLGIAHLYGDRVSLLQDGMMGMEARDRGKDCAEDSQEFGFSGSSVDTRRF
jgi:hypothetical protein